MSLPSPYHSKRAFIFYVKKLCDDGERHVTEPDAEEIALRNEENCADHDLYTPEEKALRAHIKDQLKHDLCGVDLRNEGIIEAIHAVISEPESTFVLPAATPDSPTIRVARTDKRSIFFDSRKESSDDHDSAIPAMLTPVIATQLPLVRELLLEVIREAQKEASLIERLIRRGRRG